MMHRIPFIFRGVEGHERKVGYPEKIELPRNLFVRSWISATRRRRRPSTSQAMSHLSEPKKIRSPSSSASLVLSALLFRLGEEFHDRRFPFAVFDFDKGEAFGAEGLCDRGHFVHLANRDAGESLGIDRFHHPAALDDGAEKFESALAKFLREIDQLHAETAIRFVASEGPDRVAIGQPREWGRDVDPARCFEDRGQHSLDEFEDVFRFDERGLDVDLGELRLTIGAQIFIAKAFCDLKILLDPADHEKLLVLLRRLRERVEFARREATGHEEITRAFRGALGENGRLDFNESLLVEIIARRLGDAMALAQVARDARAAQIEITIAEPEILVARIGVERERENVGAIQNAQMLRQQFDVTGGQLWILCAGNSRRHFAFHFDHIFVTESMGNGRQFRIFFRTKNDLGQSLAIAQIDENDATMIAPDMHPAGEFRDTADVGGA